MLATFKIFLLYMYLLNQGVHAPQQALVPTAALCSRKALELKPDDEEALAAMSIAQTVLQQTQQQKYSSPDSSCCNTA